MTNDPTKDKSKAMSKKDEIEAIKELRERTLAGYLDCRKAYKETKDLDEAEKLIRKRGLAEVAKKDQREAKVGIIHAYVHVGSRIGSLVEVACETDFAVRTPEFVDFTHDLAMHVAAMKPRWLSVNDIPLECVADGSGTEGDCLLSQPFVKNHNLSVGEVLASLSSKLGERCRIARFQRWEAGEKVEPAPVYEEASAAEVGSTLRSVALLILFLALFGVGFILGAI